METSAPLVHVTLADASAASTAQGPAIFGSANCLLNVVGEGDRAPRPIEIRRGPDEAPRARFPGDGAHLCSRIEEGRPVLPVWSAVVEDSGAIPVQSCTAGGISNMVTIRPEGPAFPSTHASASDPEQVLWSAAIGTCEVTETE